MGVVGGGHPLSTGCEHQSCSSAWQPGDADTQKKRKERVVFIQNNPPHTTAQTPCVYAKRSGSVQQCIWIKGCKQSLLLAQSLSLGPLHQSLSLGPLHQSLSLGLHQSPSLGPLHLSLWCQDVKPVVHCLHQFLATLLVSHHQFVCRTKHISQLSIMLQKTMQKTLDFFVS